MVFNRVAIASDHGGRLLKIVEFLADTEITVVDHGVGPAESASVDYPDFAKNVAQSIQSELRLGFSSVGRE